MLQSRNVTDMNERIKELANISVSSTGLKIDVEYLTDFQNMMEKFAELIIQECMDCSLWVGKVNKNAVEPIHTAHAINLRIKKHLGFEE